MAPLPMDRDESTVMGCDIEIYQTVIADADSDGPGSDRGRAPRSGPALTPLQATSVQLKDATLRTHSTRPASVAQSTSHVQREERVITRCERNRF